MDIRSIICRYANELHWLFAAVNERDESVAFTSAAIATAQ